MKISPARVAAYEVLRRIETEGAFSANLLPEYEANLTVRDAALTHELVLGVLRRQMDLDGHIDAHARSKKLDIEVRLAMRLGVYQLYFLDRIPAHSAINESVELVKYARKRSAAGLVNAALRSAARTKHVLTPDDGVDQLIYDTSHPRWLLEKWLGDMGLDRASELAKANNRVPSTAFRLTTRGTREAIDLSGYSQSDRTVGCIFAERIDDNLHGMAADGLIYFQDEGSQMIANAIELRPGDRFLDVCASPGGKASSVAARVPGASIFAGDVTANRVATLKSIVHSQDAAVTILRHDGEGTLPFEDASFDFVLVDAPCSGTGTIRHNPEIRYRVGPDDLSRLPAKQLQILESCSRLVRSGGQIMYTTCSLEPEENEAVIERFLNGRDDFRLKRPSVPDEFITADVTARTWPQSHEIDGFFIAVMAKR